MSERDANSETVSSLCCDDVQKVRLVQKTMYKGKSAWNNWGWMDVKRRPPIVRAQRRELCLSFH